MQERDYFYTHTNHCLFMLRIGVLMPRSSLFPSLGLDILNGLKQSLKLQGIFDEIKLLTDNIGFGIEEPEIYTKAERMLLQEDTDIVIVCADVRIGEMLQPLFTASNKILMMVHFGANLPDSWQPAPTTITHSLNFCFHARFTGKLAAQETNKQVMNLISYYDGGYHQCFSMLTANQANGGVPRFNHITHLKLKEFTIAPAAPFLEEHKDVQTLLCLFAGDQAEQFYRDISPLQQQFGLNLYVTPMMLDASLKTALGEGFSIQNVKGYIPWHASLGNEHNQVFKKYTANYFSVLGWDAALIITELLPALKNGEQNIHALIQSLAAKTFNSPRGWLKIDAATQCTYGPSYLASCRDNFDITIGPEVNNIEDEWMAFTKTAMPAGESSGWRNTYLCI